MCGITGFFSYRSSAQLDRDLLRRMNAALLHRGPDEGGDWMDDFVGLAMRRLAIIDISGGHQPMFSEDRRTAVVFNGEIYNFQELQRELLAAGHTFATHSDTEAIVHLSEAGDPAFVRRLEGMFALASYQKPSGAPHGGRGQLILARDRFGKKPLYYADVGGTLVFASELKSILLHPQVSRDVDPNAIGHYLGLHCIPGEYSIFKEVRKLPPGGWLVCNENGIRVGSYWSIRPFLQDPIVAGKAEIVDHARGLFEQAVSKRLLSEVPLGAFLSGGLDSSMVVAAMAKCSTRRVRTFSVGFDQGGRYDESGYARRVAQLFDTEHTEVVVSPDIVRDLPAALDFIDEPFADESAIPLLLLSRAARKEITVVLTGDGGDECFGGYHMYLFQKWARLARLLTPSLIRGSAAARRSAVATLGQNSRMGRSFHRFNRLLDGAVLSPAEQRIAWWATSSEQIVSGLLEPSIQRARTSMTTDLLQSYCSGIDGDLEQMAAIDIGCILPDDMLVKVDRMTMAVSIEARSPFLDHTLCEYLARVPFSVKVPGYTNRSLKHLLKEIATGVLPDDIIHRRKHGFDVPLDQWFRGELAGFAESVFHSPCFVRRGIFRAATVQQMLQRHRARAENHGPRLYAIMVFELWAQRYLK